MGGSVFEIDYMVRVSVFLSYLSVSLHFALVELYFTG